MRRYISTYQQLRAGRGYLVQADQMQTLSEVDLLEDMRSAINDGENSNYQYILDTLTPKFTTKIGVYCFSPFIFEIFPKGWQPPHKDGAKMSSRSLLHRWTLIFRHLQEIENEREKDVELKPDTSNMKSVLFAESAERYTDILEYFLITSLQIVDKALQKNPPSTYESRQEISTIIKGRINWAAQVSLMHGLQHQHVVEYQEFEGDSPLVEFLRAACAELKASFGLFCVPGGGARRYMDSIEERLGGRKPSRKLADLRIYVLNFIERPHGRFAYLLDAVKELARWVYSLHVSGSSQSIDHAVEFSLSGFEINLAWIFEQWCRREVRAALRDPSFKLKVTGFESNMSAPACWNWGSPEIKLKPDIVVFHHHPAANRNNCVVYAVIDAKYKTEKIKDTNKDSDSRDEKELPDDSVISKGFVDGIVRHDLYQLTSHMSAAQEGSIEYKGIAAYPPAKETVKGALILCSDQYQEPRCFAAGQSDVITHFSVGVPFGNWLLDGNGTDSRKGVHELLKKMFGQKKTRKKVRGKSRKKKKF